MASLAYVIMFVFVVAMAGMSWTTGTQVSISALSKKWRWLLCLTLWSQLGLLPIMFEITPTNWEWLPFIGVCAIILAGATNVLDKTDELVHIIAAIVAFVGLTGWVMLMNSVCLLPLIVCIAAGRENWKWRTEVGLIISVYMTIITVLNITIP